MEKKNRKAAWWQLYLLVPIMFLLLAGEQIRPFPGVSEEIVDFLIIGLTFGSMFLWIWVNQTRIGREDEHLFDDLKITVYESVSQQEQNRGLSHGGPPLARVSPKRTQQDVEMKELGSEK